MTVKTVSGNRQGWGGIQNRGCRGRTSANATRCTRSAAAGSSRWRENAKGVSGSGGIGVTKAQSSGVFTYHVMAAMVTIICGGLITDRFVSRDPRFRLRLQVVALLLGAPALFMIGKSTTVGAVWCFCALYGVFRGLFEVNTHTSLFDVVPARYRATAVGLMTMTGFLLGGTVGPWLVGFLMKRMGTMNGMRMGFNLMAAVYVLGGIAMLISLLVTFQKDRKDTE